MWDWAAIGFLVCAWCAIPALIRGTLPTNIAAAQLSSAAVLIALLCVAHSHDYLLDVVITAGIVSLMGGLILLHATDRWL